MTKLVDCLELHFGESEDAYIQNLIKSEAKNLAVKGRVSKAIAKRAVLNVIKTFEKDTKNIVNQLPKVIEQERSNIDKDAGKKKEKLEVEEFNKKELKKWKNKQDKNVVEYERLLNKHIKNQRKLENQELKREEYRKLKKERKNLDWKILKNKIEADDILKQIEAYQPKLKGLESEEQKWMKSEAKNIPPSKPIDPKKLSTIVPVDSIPEVIMNKLKKDNIEVDKIYRNEKVWKDTKFWLGKDNFWRYEYTKDFKDINSKLRHPVDIKKIQEKGSGKFDKTVYNLKDVYDDKVLFEKIPGLNDVKVRYSLTKEGSSFNPDTKTIEINHKVFDEKDIDFTKSFYHELQHAINNSLNAFSGASVAKVGEKIYKTTPGEMESRLIYRRQQMSLEEKAAEPPWETLNKMLEEEGTGKSAGFALYSGLDPVAAAASIMKSGKEMWSGSEPTRKKLKLTGRAFQELLLDPKNVSKRDPWAFESFKALAKAEESKNAFIDRNYKKYLKATKGIDKDSIASARIGKALDGQLDLDKLTKNEKKAFDFFKKNYEAMIVEYARRAAGSEEAYKKVLYLASRKKAKKSKVSDLAPDVRADYDNVVSELSALKAGRKLKELSSIEKRTAAGLMQMKTDLLMNDWRKRLLPNEAEAYDILSRKVNDYLPHLFDRSELLDSFKQELVEVQDKLVKATNKSVITRYKKRINLLEAAVAKMEGGGLVTFDQLPSSVFFKFFNPRKGKEGYSFDAMKAYEAYLFGMGRKMFDEPAIKLIKNDYFDKIQPGMKKYTEDLVKRYMGYDKSSFDWAAGMITSLQWMRTLGLNPRSALVNLSQRVNTIALVGEKYSLKAEGMMLFDMKRANKLFDRSGIAREVPDVLTEGDMSQGLERMRTIVGFMFNQMELGNRKHSYLAGYTKAMDEGKTREQAMKAGINLTHKTQFRYGKLGMPKLFWSPVARVAFQFSSYTLKQAQFLYKLLKESPFKFMRWIAYATGINYTLQEFFDADMSNALGIGITWGEAFQAIKALVEGDTKAAYRHLKQTITPGTGILPSGPGPTITSGVKIAEAIGKGEGKEQLITELTPIVVSRIKQAYDAVKSKKDDEELYTIRSKSKNAMYKLTKRQLIQRTVGPKTAKEAKIQKNYMRARNLEIERKQGLKSVIDAIIKGDAEDIKKTIVANKEAVILMMSQKGLLDRMVKAEILKRTFTAEERKTLGTKTKYQLLREGETY